MSLSLFDRKRVEADSGSGKISILPGAERPNSARTVIDEGILSKIGGVLTNVAVGIKNPTALLKQQEQRDKQEEFTQGLLLSILGQNAQQLNLANNKPSKIAAPKDLPSTELGVTSVKQGGVTIGQTPESKIEQNVAETTLKQSAKAREQSERNYLRTGIASDTTFMKSLQFANEQFNKFGLRPGDFLGLADVLTPKQWNQYKEAFVGSGRETAAIVGRQLIPGARGLSMFSIFAKSTASLGNTTESNINNISASMANSYGTALIDNVRVVDEETGNKVFIQDRIIDTVTGKPISKLGFEEKQRALSDAVRKFEKDLTKQYQMQTFVMNPELLKEETRVSFLESLSNEEMERLEQVLLEEEKKSKKGGK